MAFFCPSPPPPPESTLSSLLPDADLTTLDGISQLSPTDVAKLVLLFGPHLAIVYSAFMRARRLGVHGVYKAVSGAILGALQSAVPGVGAIVEAEVQKNLAGIEKEMHGDGDATALIVMPEEGMPASAMRALIESSRSSDPFIAKGGKLWGGIYHEATNGLTDLQAEVWKHFNTSNALYPKEFPSLRKMEAEIISMCVGITHGHEVGAVGLLASGGTESVLLAALAYRELARTRGIDNPQMICGISAHPAITKACHYFGIELVKAPLDPTSFRLTAAMVKPLITRRTIAIYASAPCFSFGIVDEIGELGSLALSKNLGLHVDNCLGGFLLSFMQREGLFDRPWDFAVPGVTTISIDVHKYGYASKGASVVCFRDPALRRLTYVPSADGCEGLYVTPTLQGSRSGATIAVAWATLVHTGQHGYAESAKSLAKATAAVQATVKSLEGVSLVGSPDLAIVPVRGEAGLNVYALATLLERKGWGVFTGQKPATLGIPIGERTPALLEQLLADLRETVEYMRKHPGTQPEGNAAVYGAAQAIPDAILQDVLRGYIDVKLKVKPKVVAPANGHGKNGKAH